MKRGIYAVIASIAAILATTVATSACWYFLGQPVEPKCLRDE